MERLHVVGHTPERSHFLLAAHTPDSPLYRLSVADVTRLLTRAGIVTPGPRSRAAHPATHPTHVRPSGSPAPTAIEARQVAEDLADMATQPVPVTAADDDYTGELFGAWDFLSRRS